MRAPIPIDRIRQLQAACALAGLPGYFIASEFAESIAPGWGIDISKYPRLIVYSCYLAISAFAGASCWAFVQPRRTLNRLGIMAMTSALWALAISIVTVWSPTAPNDVLPIEFPPFRWQTVANHWLDIVKLALPYTIVTISFIYWRFQKNELAKH
jgi:hypothetical protein